MTKSCSIGTFAKAAGVSVETVRYYERLKLLRQPERPVGRIRRYGPSEIERLRFIKRAKAAGFSLDEVGMLLHFEQDQSCRRTRELVAAKLRAVEGRVAELRRLRSELRQWVAECDGNDEGKACPALEALSGRDLVAADVGR